MSISVCYSGKRNAQTGETRAKWVDGQITIARVEEKKKADWKESCSGQQ